MQIILDRRKSLALIYQKALLELMIIFMHPKAKAIWFLVGKHPVILRTSGSRLERAQRKTGV